MVKKDQLFDEFSTIFDHFINIKKMFQIHRKLITFYWIKLKMGKFNQNLVETNPKLTLSFNQNPISTLDFESD